MMPSAIGEFEQLILLAVLRQKDEAYGVTIRRTIHEVTGRDVSAGAVYTALGRLEQRGFVSSRVAETAPERSGQRRKYYQVQPEGAATLYRSYSDLQRMADDVLQELQNLAAQQPSPSGA
ncbi:MAG: PadR family transcriptional regulator [Gemmatimonadetes bacterium]|nr:PadR family transcriptional regulator [Gemmatimonadota bacterium]